jgi:hypothetical protein
MRSLRATSPALGYVPPIGGGKSWVPRYIANMKRIMDEAEREFDPQRHFLHHKDAAQETPEVRAWLDECESLIAFGVPSVIRWSENQDPYAWHTRASRFLDEVSTDARTRINARFDNPLAALYRMCLLR